MKQNPIGVFDSGIGGLSVLRQLIRFMPYERYVYLGDTARVPYGNKSSETVIQYSEECTEFLLGKGVKLIVVACNTSSSVALEAVRKHAGEIPVIGMIIPAAAAALRSSSSGKIGVIGTRATIGSGAYNNAILELAGEASIKVYSQVCPLFVPLVEEGMTFHPAARLIAEEYLKEVKNKGIDTLVLGCTHYPLMSQLLMEIMPGISLIDTGEHASVTALRLLADNDWLADERHEFVIKPEIDFYITDLPSIFNELAGRFLGFAIDSPKRVSIGTH
ncbi:MAG: Glutamate racemase [Ignavibacteria bacterium]|nr:Glutamate racemase [Ignavibacteria bacterium]